MSTAGVLRRNPPRYPRAAQSLRQKRPRNPDRPNEHLSQGKSLRSMERERPEDAPPVRSDHHFLEQGPRQDSRPEIGWRLGAIQPLSATDRGPAHDSVGLH